MDSSALIDSLAIDSDAKIVFLILDGLGGLPDSERGGTELEIAHTPNFDALARRSVLGLLDPIHPGVTSGSGPGHLGLFGYDPVATDIGRGLLGAAGVGFPLTERDVAIRCNFCDRDGEGRVTDRRAGRIDSSVNRARCEKIVSELQPIDGVEIFLQTEKDHRAVLVLRGDHLSDELVETDPQAISVPPRTPAPLQPEARSTSEALIAFLAQVEEILSEETRANFLLLRGYARYRKLPSLTERFKLKNPLAIATFPMYLGIGRLLGMEAHREAATVEEEIEALRQRFSEERDFFFIHIKKTDSYGEDGNFEGKKKVIEEVDALIPAVCELNPSVLVVTGDHSTPSQLKAHSWHPSPLLLFSEVARVDGNREFSESACVLGGLGRNRAQDLMGLSLAHALRLKKFGA